MSNTERPTDQQNSEEQRDDEHNETDAMDQTESAGDAGNPDLGLIDRIDQQLATLEQELADARAERDQFRELALRARADLDNYQKRASRDREMDRKYAAQPLVTDLLNAIDNLDRAVAAAEGGGGVEGLLQGVQLVRKDVSDVFARHAIHAIVPLGEPFNPDVHEAIMQQPSAEHPPGTVLIVFRSGYVMHERVIRPAQVVVSSEPPPPPPAAEPEPESQE